MIRLTYLLRRKADRSFEDFQAYWRDVHGPLVAARAGVLNIVKYVQVHALQDPDEHAEDPLRGPMRKPFDGIAELWFRHRDDVVAALGSAEGQAAGAELAEDEARFIDFAGSGAWFGYEAPQINPTPEDLVAIPESSLAKACYPLNHLPEMNLETAQQYWRMYHGPLVRKYGPVLGIKRYVQVHRLDDELNAAFAESRGLGVEPFCGEAEVWIDLAAMAGEPNQEQIAASLALADDEKKFIDFPRSALWLGKEQVVVDRL